ncbi:MAG: alpha-L-arabinofuranosidase [Cyanobacteriota bacterium]
MRRRELLELAVSSAAIAQLFNTSCQRRTSGNGVGEDFGWATPVAFSRKVIDAKVSVDWEQAVAQTTPFTFGSNDYEIINPKKAADSVYQDRLAQLNIRLIRIHNSRLSDRWSDPDTKTWDEAKIKAGYDVSYPQNPTLIQNIPGWPKWMAQDEDGLLAPSEYDRYAAFCAELVEVLNRRQQRQVRYWEPLNEKDVPYKKAGKLDELWKIYNKVAVAMKAKDSSIQVGGPALTWDEPRRLASFLQACGPNVDFISWHRYGSGDAKEPTYKLMSYTPKYGKQVHKFRKVAAKYIPDRSVPLLLGEYNINYSWKSGEKRQNTHIGAVWFASVLKHLADAGIEMATSWHLKDGIYGMIDRKNHLRPAATVFAWGIQYLIGTVMLTESDHHYVEAMAVRQVNGERSLLLINKSAKAARLSLQGTPDASVAETLPIFRLDAKGVTKAKLAIAALDVEPLLLNPYSLVLLRFPRSARPVN